jgi:glycosyltransferase involved in cell wall biosynthesis
MKNDKVRLLLIAFSDSIHTARWIEQIDFEQFEVHLFPSIAFKALHPKIKNIIFHSPDGKRDTLDISVKTSYFSVKSNALSFFFGKQLGRKVYRKLQTNSDRINELAKVVKKINPDFLHSFETQHAGYLVTELTTGNIPIPYWIHSTWGIDLHYFQKFEAHRLKLRNMLSKVNLLVTEGERDCRIAEELGYTGETRILASVGGGFDLDIINQYENNMLPSKRRKIILKGYEGGERQAGKVIMALRKIKEMLNGFEVVVYSCNNNLLPLISEIQRNKEFRISAQGEVGYGDMLKLTASARMSITNNLSDGVPNTMLEAMAFGTFPIQSETAITDGWIKDGFNGLLTQPQDIDQIASTIKIALSDDNLVDNASEYNKLLIRKSLDNKEIRIVINKLYDKHFSLTTNHAFTG